MKPTPRNLRRRGERAALELVGMVRRFTVGIVSAAGLWQLRGDKGAYDEDEVVEDVEVFGGVGFVSKPKKGSTSAEAIAVSVNANSGHQVVIATRDKRWEIQVDDDEVAIHNSTGARVIVKQNGEVHVTDSSGAAVPLATLESMEALADVFDSWTPVPMDGGAALKALLTTLINTGWPTGTTVLKGK